MKRTVLFFCFSFLFISFLYGQENTISSVRIEGNKRIATETYLYYISVKPGSPYDLQTLRNDFRRLWETGFLDDLKILTEETPSGIEVIFRVVEKPLLKNVEFTGNKKIKQEDIDTKLKDENITLRTDQPMDPHMVKKATVAIEKLMVEKGLQFGKVTMKTEPVGDTGTKLTFVIDEGPKVKIGDIQFDGNRVFSDGKLKRRMKHTKEAGLFTWITRKDDFEREKFEKDIERVQELYFNHGYINARVDEPEVDLYEENTFFGKKKRMRLTIPVQEGEQYRAGQITFSGSTIFTEKQLLQNIELKPGKVFNRSLLKRGMEEIQKMYGNEGYIYASLAPLMHPDQEKKTVNVNIEIEENGQFYVHRIEFTGNNYTRDKVIRREMELQEGELLRVNKFRESLDRIYRLGFFDDLKPNITPAEEPHQADISIDVKENKRNEIRLGGGYSEFEGFFGNLVFSTKNLFGTGKIFTINLQGGSRSENYGIELLEPYFLDRPISLGFSVFKTRYDFFNFLRDTTGGSITIGFPIVEEFKSIFTYGYQIVDIERPQNPNQRPDLDDIFPGFELFQNDRVESRIVPQLVRSTINNPTDPTRGTRFVFGHEIVGGILGGDLNYYKPTLSFTHYVRGLSRKHFFAYNVEFGYGMGFGGQELPFYERYFLGGDRSIRGYELRFVSPLGRDPKTGQIFLAGGNKFFVINVEYVIPVAGPLKFATFLDYGNAFAAGDGIDFTDMRGSTGVELRFLAPFLSAPFRFIYAVNFNRGELMTLPITRRPERSVFRFSVGTTF